MSRTHSVISALFFLLVSTISKVDAASSTTLIGTRTTAAPTGPAITLSIPGSVTGVQTLVGSLIGTASQLTTVAIGCPAGTNTNDCLLVGTGTLTGGPTTLALTLAIDDGQFTVQENCKFSSGGGFCTFVAPALLIGNGTDTTLSTSSASLAPTDIANARIILTAGNTAGLVSATMTSATMTSRTTGSASPTSSGSNAATTTSMSTKNDARVLTAGGMGAALLGLAAVVL